MPDYTQTPAYQRAIQKLMTLSPSQNNILDTIEADTVFASDAMRKRLQGMRLSAGELQRKRALDLSQQQADFRYGLTKRGLDFGRGQRRLADLVGVGDVVASGYLGKQQSDADIALARQLGALSSSRAKPTAQAAQRPVFFRGR